MIVTSLASTDRAFFDLPVTGLVARWNSESVFTKSVANRVQSWYSLDGNYALSQVTADKRPTYYASHLNGFATVGFDGTSQYLSETSLDLAGNFSLISIVAKFTGTGANKYFLDTTYGTPRLYYSTFTNLGLYNTYNIFQNTMTQITCYSPPVIDVNTWFVYTCMIPKADPNANDYSGWGISKVGLRPCFSTTGGANQNFKNLYLGAANDGTYCCPIEVADLVVCNSNYPWMKKDLDNVNEYLTQRYRLDRSIGSIIGSI